ncbi:MAG: class A sortase [Turicibacter sp.]|nr:class A sortase [Turicibacter sp.]
MFTALWVFLSFSMPLPVPDGLKAVGEISIPAIECHLPIYGHLDDDTLLYGAAEIKEGQAPAHGNYALASHHMRRKGWLFNDLDQLEAGDAVLITKAGIPYLYFVKETFEVDPSQTQVISDDIGDGYLTLVTCTPDWEKRLIVWAEYFPGF